MSDKLVSNYKIQYVSLKLRLNPSQEQKILFDKSFGCVRKAYNFWLEERNQFYEKKIKPIDESFDDYKNLRKEIYKTFKPTSTKEIKNIFPYMKEVSAQGISNAYMDLCGAYSKFFKGQTNLPKFHSKKDKNSYRDSMMKQDCLNWNQHSITIPKIGNVKIFNQKAPSWYKNRTKVCSLTLSKSSQEKYYVSILFEIKQKVVQKSKTVSENQAIGLDFDLHDFYIDSNGKSGRLNFGWRQFKQEDKKLKHLQRQLAHTKPQGMWIDEKEKKHYIWGKNHEKLRRKIALEEEHISNARRDWQEKESLRLVSSYKAICIEDLNIQGMMKGSRNAKNYLDASWSQFVGLLQRKAEIRDCRVIKINRFYPSSQTCFDCGFKFPLVAKKHLEIWTCPQCGQVHQRDENASRNILREGLKVLREAEESSEKSESLSKDTSRVLSTEELANLALA